MNRRLVLTVAIGCAALAVVLDADTLYLRDGRRVEGTLISVRDNVVEFEAQRGGFFGGRDRLRLDREEIVRIEFDDSRDRDRSDLGATSGNRGNGSAGVGSGGGNGRPSGLRERDVRVEARNAWTDTGVTVRAGQTIYFDATGRVRWGPGRQDGPEGERGSPRNDARPIPSRPAAALIGRIGEGDEYFFIGDGTEGIRMRSAGKLYLGLNDDFLNDNSGAFGVTISY